jgi:predicted ferric reductase
MMAARTTESDSIDSLSPTLPWQGLLLLLFAVAAGAFAAVIALPTWLPSLSESLLGPEPKAYWRLSRSSAMVAFWLLWLALALGLTITNRLARLWPGGPVAFDLHQHFSLLGLAFALFHALILTGDRYIGYSLAQALVPFASVDYRPIWVGLGQVGLYLLMVIAFSFYVRRWIGRRVWRALHFLSFALYALVLLHGLYAGTDSETLLAHALYWGSGVSLLLLAGWRIRTTLAERRRLAKARRV